VLQHRGSSSGDGAHPPPAMTDAASPWSDPAVLHGRPSPTSDGSRLVYVSTTLPAAALRRSWAAVYSAPILHSSRGHPRSPISLSKVLTHRGGGLAALAGELLLPKTWRRAGGLHELFFFTY
jgi:hypothetical protein